LSYIIFVSDYDVNVFPFFLFHSSVHQFTTDPYYVMVE